MHRPILGLFLFACGLASANAQGTLLDGQSEFTRGTNAWNQWLEADLTGVSFPPTADNLNQVGWAFRVLGDTRETFMPVPDSQHYDLEPQSQIEWFDLDNRGLLSATERVTLSGSNPMPGGTFDGEVRMVLQLTNIAAAPVTLDVFHVLDMNVAGTPTDDAASLVLPISEPTIRFTDAQGLIGYYTGDDVDAFAVRTRGFDDVHAMLADDDLDDFDDGGLPADSDDLIAGFQWDNRTLQPGETLTVEARFSINRPSIESDLQVVMAATPNPVQRGEVLELSASVLNNGETPSPGTQLVFDVGGSDVSILGTQGCTNDPAGYPECTVGLLQPGTNAVVSLRVSPGDDTEAQLPVEVRAGSTDASESTPVDNTATVLVDVVSPSVDLQLVKSNDVDGVATDIDGWHWTLSLGNSTTAVADAQFAAGSILLVDQMPDEDVVYGEPTIGFAGDEEGPDVSGTASCTIEAFDLVCIATSAMTFPPGARIDVRVPVLPQAFGMYNNPRLLGQCIADPANVVQESSETNNACLDNVLSVDFMLFEDGFED